MSGDPEHTNPYFQNSATKKKILFLCNYLQDKGWKEGINMQYKSMDSYKKTGIVGFGGSMGNNFLGYSLSVFLNKKILSENNLLENELKTLNWISNVVGPQYNFKRLWEITGYNTDGVRAMFNNRLCYILSLPDNDLTRTKEAKYFSRLFNKSLQIANGWADLIKSDYMEFHHKNAYLNAYAVNAFHTASLIVYLLEGTNFQVDKTAISNLSNTVLQMRIYSNKYDCPRASSGRFPYNLNSLIQNIQCYTYLAQIESPFRDQMKSVFASLWDPSYEPFVTNYIDNITCKIMYHGSIGAIELSSKLAAENNTEEKTPNGFWFYPYGGLGIYRQNEWLLSSKGNSKYIWDFESSKTQNLYGRFVSAGTLRILAGGNPISTKESGYTTDGWNWNQLPGTTTFDMPFEEIKSKNTRSFTSESFLGGISINDKSGMISLKNKDP